MLYWGCLCSARAAMILRDACFRPYPHQPFPHPPKVKKIKLRVSLSRDRRTSAWKTKGGNRIVLVFGFVATALRRLIKKTINFHKIFVINTTCEDVDKSTTFCLILKIREQFQCIHCNSSILYCGVKSSYEIESPVLPCIVR